MHALWNSSRFTGITGYETWEDTLREHDDSARLTGIEHIHADPGPDTPALTSSAGPNAVTIHLIDWDAEPGARDAHENRHPRPCPTSWS